MRKEQKAAVIEEVAAQIKESDAVYAVDYRGITVSQVAELRSSLRETGASFRIVKNTLTLRAAEQAGADDLKEVVAQGPTALTFVSGDPAAAAKALYTFSRQAKIDFKGGLLGSAPVTAEDILQMARLPSRDSLNAQLAGLVASPLTGLVGGLGSMISGLAIALGQVRQQKEEAA